MADESPSSPSSDAFWLDQAWNEVRWDKRDDLILRARPAQTLDEIGKVLALTQERVRQLESRAHKRLRYSIKRVAPDALSEFLAAVPTYPVLSLHDLSEFLPSEDPVRSRVAARAFGLEPARAWGQVVPDLWTPAQKKLDASLKRVTSLCPVTDEDLCSLAATGEFRDHTAISKLLSTPRCPVVMHANAEWWVRRRAQIRDAAYLYLQSEGEPRSTSAVSIALGLGDRAMREQLRRDDRFTQLRPAGTWALTQWGLANAEGPRNAADAVAELMDRHGAMSFDSLMREMRDFYPVTAWRVNQVLASEIFGRYQDGRYGLVRHGAVAQGGPEPSPHPSVSVSPDGTIVGYRQAVTHDVLRGSGLAVPRFLAWRLGARAIPSVKSFAVLDSDEVLVVRSRTSNAQLSSLRRFALELGVIEGCLLGVIFRPAAQTVRVAHGCDPHSCPVQSAGS